MTHPSGRKAKGDVIIAKMKTMKKTAWLTWLLAALMVWIPGAQAERTDTSGKEPPVSTPSGPLDKVAGLKVAVVEFDTRGNFAIPYAGSIVAEWMINELGHRHLFSLVERVLLKKVLAEQELAEQGFLSSGHNTTRLGELYGVDAIVTGSILKWQQEITITARLIDTTSGEIIRTASASARHISQAPRLISRLATELTTTPQQITASQKTVPDSPDMTSPGPEHTRTESGPPVGPISPKGQADISSSDIPVNALLPVAAEEAQVTNHGNRYWREEITGIRFVWIEPGCFIMGQSKADENDGISTSQIYHEEENPAHRVCLDGFWIAETETTNAQYRAIYREHASGSFRGVSLDMDNQPVLMVSWQDARAFASLLTRRYQEMGASFRLSTEAEWEYAARAGTGGNYPWERTGICRMANGFDSGAYDAVQGEISRMKCNDGHALTAPVASYPPNAWGLYDMIGNVREWVQDVFNENAYLAHSEQNPVYLGVGTMRVTRGGSWLDGAERLRSSARTGVMPETRSAFTGFRLVMERK